MVKIKEFVRSNLSERELNMKIGEFAEICGTKISVLRHYDSQGLLKPDHVDGFTGYRYYSPEQAELFRRISALKMAGFSLAEIRELIREMECGENIEQFFENKRAELERVLCSLEQAKHYLTGAGTLEKTKNTLNPEVIPLHDDINLPFEDDQRVIGKWEIIGEYAVKQDFYNGLNGKEEPFFEATNSIYFLPHGERYWCFGWTKGKFIIETGYEQSVNDYETADIGSERYIFIKLKSYCCKRGGMPTILVLKQLDTRHYSADEIARKDDIDKPFVNDERVLGKWKAFDFTLDKNSWLPENKTDMQKYFESIEFLRGGECISVYGGEVISGEDLQVWTKGYVLRKWNSSACAYEIRKIDGVEYLIIEWKSGDYRWGGFDTDYYVFVRA